MDAAPSQSSSPPSRIAVVSFFILALELALIRQIPAEIKAISYFTNLILISSFFGLGLGCILQQQRSLTWLLPSGLLLLFGFIYVARGIVIYEDALEVHYWLQDANPSGTALQLPLFPSALLAFVFSALPFVALGQLLAQRMDEHPRLVAYSWDIGGSVLGTAVFALGSFLHWPPWIWPPLLMVVWAVLFVRTWPSRLAHLLAGALFFLFLLAPNDPRWSPYYLVQHDREEVGLRVWVNSSFHQLAIDFENLDDADERSVAQRMVRKFSIPYDVYRKHHDDRSPERVLILGAGTGNDVNIAILNEAKRVVAVEIDPVIMELGREFNTTRPYDDPRVEVHIDDARHFLRNCDETFDLIVFATLDSQTLLSGVANLRLENYVYTVEAFQEAAQLLEDDGMVGLFYSVMKPWLYGRIFSTVSEAFGNHAQLMTTRDPFLFNTAIVATAGIEEFVADEEMIELLDGFRPNTDDWPYLYLEKPLIAPIYIKLFAAIAVLIGIVFLILRAIHPVTGLHANYLFLGMGFTLLESAAIVRLALVFGSTWVVNAIVFGSALLTILLANVLVLKGKAPPLRAAWIGVVVAVLANYFFPVQLLIGLDVGARFALAALLIGAPIFFAAVCFSRLFQREKVTGYPLGINLIGAMSGALLEYSSMLIGMRDVWLVLLVIYLLAMLTSRQKKAS